MSRHGKLQLDFVSADDGRHRSIDCPHTEPVYGAFCDIYGPIHCRIRPPACIAAEQAAASVPSCEGARGLDASEALREARVQGMREGHEIACRWLDDVKRVVSGEALGRAIEAVRKGER